jgi:predicted PurR-regulated permease PerM
MEIAIKDIIYWVFGMLIAIIGWFLNKTINKIEAVQESHAERIGKVETGIAVIGRSVDNNFASLSSSVENLQAQLSEIKALLIEQIKNSK